MIDLKSLFQKDNQPFVSIDITPDEIKVLELAYKNKEYIIMGYSTEALGSDIIDENSIIDPEQLGLTISRAINKSQSSAKKVAFALSGPQIFKKILEMNKNLTEFEKESQINFSASDYISHDLEDLNIDFQTIKPAGVGEEMEQVLLIACKKDLIENYNGAIEISGLKTDIIDIKELAMQNACNFVIEQEEILSNEDTIAFLDIQKDKSFLSIYKNEECLYNSDIQNIKSEDLYSLLKSELFVDDMKELNQKIEEGEIKEEEVEQNIISYMETVSFNIDNSIQFFTDSHKEQIIVTHLVLTGEITNMSGFEKSLESFDYKTIIGNPLKNMKAKNKVIEQQAKNKGSDLMIATGLAMRIKP